jgi:hypothetical protein
MFTLLFKDFIPDPASIVQSPNAMVELLDARGLLTRGGHDHFFREQD